MTVISDILSFVAQTLLGEFLVVVAGVLFAHLVQNWWEQKRYGQWRVRILRGGKTILDRGISPPKAKEILEEPAELSVFLKGVVSPYAWIRCDILEEGVKRGLLVENREERVFVVDLDRNPAQDGYDSEDPIASELEARRAAMGAPSLEESDRTGGETTDG